MSSLIEKWREACRDLGIAIVAPYELALGNGVNVMASLLVRNFGGRNGTLVVTDYGSIEPCREQIISLGYGFAVLEEPVNSNDATYDRESFIELLSEWDWTGENSERPKWIVGNKI